MIHRGDRLDAGGAVDDQSSHVLPSAHRVEELHDGTGIKRSAQREVLGESARGPVDRRGGIEQFETESDRAGQIAEDHEQTVARRLDRHGVRAESFDDRGHAAEVIAAKGPQHSGPETAVALGIRAQHGPERQRFPRDHAALRERGQSVRREVELARPQEGQTAEKESGEHRRDFLAGGKNFVLTMHPGGRGQQSVQPRGLRRAQPRAKALEQLPGAEVKLGGAGGQIGGGVQLRGMVQIEKHHRPVGWRRCGSIREAPHMQAGQIEPAFDQGRGEADAMGGLEGLAAHGLERAPLAGQGVSSRAVGDLRPALIAEQEMRLAPGGLQPRAGRRCGFALSQRIANTQNLGGQAAGGLLIAGPCLHRRSIDAEVIGVVPVAVLAALQKPLPGAGVGLAINLRGLFEPSARALGRGGAETLHFGQAPAQAGQIAFDPGARPDFFQAQRGPLEGADLDERKDFKVSQACIDFANGRVFVRLATSQGRRDKIVNEERPARVRRPAGQTIKKLRMRGPKIRTVTAAQKIRRLEGQGRGQRGFHRGHGGIRHAGVQSTRADAVALAVEGLHGGDGCGAVDGFLGLRQRGVRNQVRRGLAFFIADRPVTPALSQAVLGPAVVNALGQQLDEGIERCGQRPVGVAVRRRNPIGGGGSGVHGVGYAAGSRQSDCAAYKLRPVPTYCAVTVSYLLEAPTPGVLPTL